MSEIRLIKSDVDIDKEIEFISGPILSVDTETVKLDPFTGSLETVQIYNEGKCSVFRPKYFSDNGKKKFADFLSRKDIRKIFHNAKFDIKFLRKHLGITDIGPVYDTMIASQLDACGDMSKRHNLKAVANRYVDIDLDKAEVTSDWSRDELTKEQMEYIVEDVRHLRPIWQKQWENLKDQDMQQVTELEFNAIEPTAWIEYNGIGFDPEKWKEIYYENDSIRQQKRSSIVNQANPHNMLFEEAFSFNPASSTQLIYHLQNLGIKLPTVIDKKTGLEKITTEAEQLSHIINQHPIIEDVIEFKQRNKACTSYGLEYLDFINELTKRIHPSYWQIGTLTGRYACTEPNFQQVPRESKYRNCFVARPGYKIVWIDFSQFELRILAFLSGDKNMLRAFTSHEDLHTFTARSVYNVSPSINIEPWMRVVAKDLNFGIVYGVGAAKFARKSGMSFDDAESAINKYKYETYPQATEYLEEAAYLARTRRQSRTKSGRLIKYRFDPNDNNAASKVERNGKNTPIQGLNADILKVCIRRIFNETQGQDVYGIGMVHDEGIFEIREDLVEEWAPRLGKIMTESAEKFITTVPIEVDIKIGDCWSK